LYVFCSYFLFTCIMSSPVSTLFPYTTLFRSLTFYFWTVTYPRSGGPYVYLSRGAHPLLGFAFSVTESFILLFYGAVAAAFEQKRSEEHTSELQSLAYIVCRLLLEKKKIPLVI